MRTARVVLVAVGVVGIGFGVLSLVQHLRFDQVLWVAVWLACAIVIHDGFVAPVVGLLDFGLRRAGRRLRPLVRGVISGGFIVGAVLSLAVVPEIYAQSRGPANPTVLPSDYGTRLVWVWVAIIVLVACTVTVSAVVTRRRAPQSE